MSRYNDALKLKLAWQSAYEQRTCPGTDILYAESVDDNLQKHLSFCEVCRENRAMQQEEITAWQGLLDKMSGSAIQPGSGTTKQEGQIWTLHKSLGAWREDGRYFQSLAVLLLKKSEKAAAWKVAQLYEDKRLMGDGDVPLDDRFGFAEGWNCYEVKEGALGLCFGCVKQDELKQVIAASATTVAEPEDGSILFYFRSLESEIGSFMALQAKPVAVESAAEEPYRFDVLIQKFADWFRPLLSPAPLAVAAAIVAVISIAVLNSGKEQNTQVAQAPESAPVVPPKMQTQPQATPQVTPQQPTTPAKPTAPAYSPTLAASADSVRNSSAITKATTVEQQQFGFTGQMEPDRAAFRIGVAFVDLNVAIKTTDTTAYDNATKQLKALIPGIAGKTLIPLPSMADGKTAAAKFAGELEQIAAKSGQLGVLQFGAWLQSARLADDVHLVKMSKPSVVALLRKNLPGDSLTPSVITAFDALSKLGGAKEMDIRKIRRALDELYSSY